MIKINGVDKESTLYKESNNIGAYHLSTPDRQSVYEIQRTNNFEFVVPSSQIDGILKAGATSTGENSKFAHASEVLRLSNVTAPVPHFTQSQIEVKKGNSTIKFAGVPTFPSGTVKFNDYIGADTKEVLMAWQNLSYNVKTQKVGIASDYKKEAYLIEYSPDYQQVRRWVLHGCWISGLSESGFDNETNNKNTIDCTIQYDYAELDTSDIDI